MVTFVTALVLLVNVLCSDWLGTTGLVLAILGIVAAPMSTGGTAFRAARLIVADFTRFGQTRVWRRVLTAAPLTLHTVIPAEGYPGHF